MFYRGAIDGRGNLMLCETKFIVEINKVPLHYFLFLLPLVEKGYLPKTNHSLISYFKVERILMAKY